MAELNELDQECKELLSRAVKDVFSKYEKQMKSLRFRDVESVVRSIKTGKIVTGRYVMS